MELNFLNDIIVIFMLSVFVLFVCHKIKMPAILGFILAGIIAGPSGLKLLKNIHDVEILSEIGVILLLFTIGIEYSFKSLLKIKKAVLLGGTLQVFITVVIVYLVSRRFDFTIGESIFNGFLVSLSSTAIVMRIFQQNADLETPHGRTSLAILIYQDLITIPMMILIPNLSGKTNLLDTHSLYLIAKGLGVVILIILCVKYIIPNLLHQVARTRMPDLFLLAIFLICLGIIYMTSKIGLSLALGAFIAGLIISESEYSHQALGNIMPFKELFASFFFFSIGLLLDVQILIQRPVYIFGITIALILLKSLVVGIVSLILRLPLRNSIIIGLSLAQVGEFSFILAKYGMQFDLFTKSTYQIFIAVSILSMGVTPLLINIAPGVAKIILKFGFPEKIKSGLSKDLEEKSKKENHIIIVGFGVNGKNLAKAAKEANIDYIIIETNPDTVQREKKLGEPIFYGDATHEVVLEYADIEKAKVMVIAINDAAATRRITVTAKRTNPHIHLIVRTRFLQEVNGLYILGADEVIPEEFETSIEIFTRVLMKYFVPRNEIEKFIKEIRSDRYQMFRSFSKKKLLIQDLKITIPDFDIYYYKINEKSFLNNRSIIQSDLRKIYGVNIVAVGRGDDVILNPPPDTVLYKNDIIIVLGKTENLNVLTEKLEVNS